MKKSIKNIIKLVSISSISLFMGCSNNIGNNPLLADSTAPFSAPRFDLIENEHFLPAFKEAIKEARAEVDKIAASTEEVTFENSIVALEQSGKRLSEISTIFFNLNSCNTNDTMQQIALEVTPLLTQFSNDVSLNQELFKRVKGGWEDAKERSLTGEQMRLAEESYRGFIRGGAALEGESKERYRTVSQQLSELTLKFEQNLLAATNDYFLHITEADQLEGLPSFVVEAAKEAAADKNLEGWVITLHAPSYIPFMQYSSKRELREKMWRAYSSRCLGGNFSNEQNIRDIVNLRLEKANLLGYKTHAHYVLEHNMAKNSEKVFEFANDLNNKSIEFGKKEVKEIESYAKKSCNFQAATLEPWDFGFYSEKYKKERYSLSDELLKPYFKLENCIEGVFTLCNKLYGITFEKNNSIPLYHEDVEVFEVKESDGSLISLLYLDFFPRESKNSGAWMTSYREQSYINGERVIPFVSVVCNFSKPTATTPSLLTFNEVNTFLHEMGHALHGIFANGEYTSMSGTNVARDFVELPSQIMENWASESEFLQLWAKHYQTGESIPMEYIQRIEESKRYLACYSTARQLGFVFTDMAWHTLTSPIENTLSIEEFEKEATKKVQLLPFKDNSCFSTTFSHIFAGGYSSGYYSYKWAELLEADGFKLFQEKGIFNSEVAKSFRDNILSKGDSADAMELYVNFRGCEPDNNSLIEKMGIATSSK